MSKPKFFKSVLVEVDPMEYAYGNNPRCKGITLEERLPGGKCEDCGGTEWIFLPKEGAAVREGMKPYIECVCCGYQTHL